MENNYQNKGYGKRPLWQWIVLYLIIGGLAYGAIYYFFIAKKGGYAPSSSVQNSSTPSAINAVGIINFAFNPATRTVKAGTKVTWTNQDSVAHQIKSANFNSEVLNYGNSFEYTFTQKGIYDYTCAIHPSMKGTIIVE